LILVEFVNPARRVCGKITVGRRDLDAQHVRAADAILVEREFLNYVLVGIGFHRPKNGVFG
jgi:hypothetical protein